MLSGSIWFLLKLYELNKTAETQEKCIAIVRTDWYNEAGKGDTKIFERSVILWQQNQLICTQE